MSGMDDSVTAPVLLGHYAKDVSVTNLAGPGGMAKKPAYTVKAAVQIRRGGGHHYEVDLHLTITAGTPDKPLFAVRIAYGGLFDVRRIAEPARQAALRNQAVAALYPPALRTVRDVLHNAGLPAPEAEQLAAFDGEQAAQDMINPDKTLVQRVFATQLYSAALEATLNAELHAAILKLAADDETGKAWCKANLYRGYTSYASVRDLPRRDNAFAALVKHLDDHVARFAEEVAFDMNGRKLVLDSFWVNLLTGGGLHPAHFHPHSAVSGTYYVSVPEGAGAICFEDPRLGLMMAAPPRTADAHLENRNHVTVRPRAGLLLLWESWLRHGVDPNASDKPRISISFNYRSELAAA